MNDSSYILALVPPVLAGGRENMSTCTDPGVGPPTRFFVKRAEHVCCFIYDPYAQDIKAKQYTESVCFRSKRLVQKHKPNFHLIQLLL